jgi:hypothetical protein
MRLQGKSIDGTHLNGQFEILSPTTDPYYRLGQALFFQHKAERAAKQAESDNGHVPEHGF